MTKSLNICLPCGICCDGTLIGHVQLEAEEIPALKAIKDIELENDNGFFLQPCTNFCGNCNIYSKRPKQCAQFECGLLKSVELKELNYDTAIDIVDLVKLKRVEIEQQLSLLQIVLKSDSFHFKMTELKILLKQKSLKSPLSMEELELQLTLLNLEKLISQNFDVTF